MGLCVSVIQRTRTWDSVCLTNRGLRHGTLCVCHTEDLDMGFCVSDLKRTLTWDSVFLSYRGLGYGILCV